VSVVQMILCFVDIETSFGDMIGSNERDLLSSLHPMSSDQEIVPTFAGK